MEAADGSDSSERPVSECPLLKFRPLKVPFRYRPYAAEQQGASYWPFRTPLPLSKKDVSDSKL